MEQISNRILQLRNVPFYVLFRTLTCVENASDSLSLLFVKDIAVAGCGDLKHYTSRKVLASEPDEVNCYQVNPSSRTKSVTEMSTRSRTRKCFWGRVRPVREAYNLVAIFGSIAHAMLDPQYLKTLWTSTACFRDSVTSL
jgi:hypothetical protein